MDEDGIVICDIFERMRRIVSSHLAGNDGDQGMGISESRFNETLQLLETNVMNPYVNICQTQQNSVEFVRLQKRLVDLGEVKEKSMTLSRIAKTLKKRLEIEATERQMGLVHRLSEKFPCGLPSRLYTVAQKLELDPPDMDPDEGKLYLTLGKYLMLDFTYEESSIALDIHFAINEEGDTRTLEEESTDILQSLRSPTKEGLSILALKFQALLRRARLEVMLKAGPLRDLESPIEKSIVGSPCTRVSRGLMTAMDPLYTCIPIQSTRHSISNDSKVRLQTEFEQQRFFAEFAPRESPSEASGWQSLTVLSMNFEPPIAVTASTLRELSSFCILPAPTESQCSEATEGMSLCWRLSEDTAGRDLFGPSMCLFVTDTVRKCVIHVEGEEKRMDASRLLHNLYLDPSRHEAVGQVIPMLKQQARFNLLLSSCIHSSKIVFASKSEVDVQNEVHRTKRKRVIQCEERREFLISQNVQHHAVDSNVRVASQDYWNDLFESAAQEKRISLTVISPRLLRFSSNDNTILEVTVKPGGTIEVSDTSLENVLNRTNCIPIALDMIREN